MCFSLAWLLNLLIWLIVVGAIVAIVRVVLPKILANFGEAGGMVMQILNIVMWAVVLIAVVVFAFEMIACLLGSGMHLPRLG